MAVLISVMAPGMHWWLPQLSEHVSVLHHPARSKKGAVARRGCARGVGSPLSPRRGMLSALSSRLKQYAPRLVRGCASHVNQQSGCGSMKTTLSKGPCCERKCLKFRVHDECCSGA
eukprot:1608371-Prymnesium_polylepis.1